MRGKKEKAIPHKLDDSDEEELSNFINDIRDDGSEMEPSVEDSEDIPTSEIRDVIKKLKFDRFQTKVQSTEKKQNEKKPKNGGNVAGNKRMSNKPDNDGSLKHKSGQEKAAKEGKSKGKKQKKQTNGDELEGKKTKETKRTALDRLKCKGDAALNRLKCKGDAALNRLEDKGDAAPRDSSREKPEVMSGRRGSIPDHLQLPETSAMLLPTGVKWFEVEQAFREDHSLPSQEDVVLAYKDYATKLYDSEVDLYATKKDSETGSQSRWMQTVVKSGALSDKVAALTLEVQHAPFHTPLSMDGLLAMVRKKGRREALIGLDAVKRLFLEELLPSNRKLKAFSQHSFEILEKKCDDDCSRRNRQILLWFYEDQLKQNFAAFLDVIEKMLQDTVSEIKSKALLVCYELLVNRPEEEKRLLRLIINKVGDPNYKVAAKAVYWLQKLVEVHMMMKFVVVQAVEELLFRPNVNTKAQYYAICFLNQLVLNPEEDKLATQLIVVYLSFFKACTKQKTIDNKMLSAVITGVHRAFPYSQEDDKVHEQLNTLFKVIHQVAFNTSIQALLLVKQVLDKRKATMDRFYSALYRKLLDPQLSTSPRHAMFLNLLFQTLKEDEVVDRVKAFVKRLLQVCAWQQPPFVAATLVLLSELIRIKPSLGIVNSWNDGSDDEHFVDVEEEDEKGNGTGPGQTQECTSGDKSSWFHRQKNDKGTALTYDAFGRNPLYAHIGDAVMWELRVLSRHFHPSVALFASQLLEGDTVSYTGNPLQDFTSTRFLDRFVYRNPKQKLVGRESVMQPKSRSYKPPAIRTLPVNSKEFTSLTEENVPIDERFFHRFFSQKNQIGKMPSRTKKSKKKVEEVDEAHSGDSEESETDEFDDEPPDEIDSDASSISDEEFDRILDEMESDLEDKVNEEDNIDFAGEFQKRSTGKKSKKRKAEEEEEEEDSSDEDEDEEDEGGHAFWESEGIEGLDEEAFEMSDEEVKPSKASKPKREQQSKKAKKFKGQGDLSNVTEKISSMIDENVGSKFDTGLNALANKDKADMKQLRWEADRDRWVRGVDFRSKIRAKKLSRGPKATGFRGKMRGKRR